MNPYITGLQNAIETGTSFSSDHEIHHWWNEQFIKSCKEQIKLYKIGKGRLN